MSDTKIEILDSSDDGDNKDKSSDDDDYDDDYKSGDDDYKLEEKMNANWKVEVKLHNLEVDLNKMASVNLFTGFQSDVDKLEEYLDRFQLCMLAPGIGNRSDRTDKNSYRCYSGM